MSLSNINPVIRIRQIYRFINSPDRVRPARTIIIAARYIRVDVPDIGVGLSLTAESRTSAATFGAWWISGHLLTTGCVRRFALHSTRGYPLPPP